MIDAVSFEGYLDTYEKKLCTGCRACEQVCPKLAITMKEDEESFYYPVINEVLCIHCDLCKKACPVSNSPEKNKNYKLYAAQIKDKTELKNSTSGGMFIAVAKEVIKGDGVVFGCVFDKDFNVYITSAEKYEDLLPMQGSKYVQADTKNTFKQAREYLIQNRKVLYTGTPCQIAGLKKYLGKDYENLITIDFLCHGVPSNKLFKSNVSYLKKKSKSQISDYKFRDKSKRDCCMMTSFKLENGRKIYQFGRINEYLNAFIMGWSYRRSCYECKFVGIERYSDITIGDFWGIADNNKEFESYKGISFAMFNTTKGERILEQLKPHMILSERNMDEAFEGNKDSLEKHRNMKISENRDVIYKNIDNYEFLANGILKPRNLTNLKVKQVLPKFLVCFIRKIKNWR